MEYKFFLEDNQFRGQMKDCRNEVSNKNKKITNLL